MLTTIKCKKKKKQSFKTMFHNLDKKQYWGPLRLIQGQNREMQGGCKRKFNSQNKGSS